jgi:hypothetical protein
MLDERATPEACICQRSNLFAPGSISNPAMADLSLRTSTANRTICLSFREQTCYDRQRSIRRRAGSTIAPNSLEKSIATLARISSALNGPERAYQVSSWKVGTFLITVVVGNRRTRESKDGSP